MSKAVERFSNRVENYVRYRPGYPKEIIRHLTDETGFNAGFVVADIGSGTGISAKLFLDNDNTVYGIEPNEPMRRAAEEMLSSYPNFHSVNGTAEATGLGSESIDLVTASQAFHWFDKAKTPAEFRRILKPGGPVALIWNERRLDTTPFLREYERFLLEYSTDYESVRHDQINNVVLNQYFGMEFRQKAFYNEQALDFEGLKGRVLSASYMPAPGDERYEAAMASLSALFTKHAKEGKIIISYDTNVYLGQI
jgi:ubiquinone/menaquinone biosynthesis C-methylase UbiE